MTPLVCALWVEKRSTRTNTTMHNHLLGLLAMNCQSRCDPLWLSVRQGGRTATRF